MQGGHKVMELKDFSIGLSKIMKYGKDNMMLYSLSWGCTTQN